MTDNSISKEMVDLQRRLAELDRERASVLTALEQLKFRHAAEAQSKPPAQSVLDVATITTMSNAEKVALVSFALPWS